jgi:DnaK suppressor protein
MDPARSLARLREERETTRRRIATMDGDLDDIVSAATHANTDDEHDPEGSTIAFVRAQITALRAEALGYLDELDRAQARVSDGTYDRCERCDGEIEEERLVTRPATSLCVECARK